MREYLYTCMALAIVAFLVMFVMWWLGLSGRKVQLVAKMCVCFIVAYLTIYQWFAGKAEMNYLSVAGLILSCLGFYDIYKEYKNSKK